MPPPNSVWFQRDGDPKKNERCAPAQYVISPGEKSVKVADLRAHIKAIVQKQPLEAGLNWDLIELRNKTSSLIYFDDNEDLPKDTHVVYGVLVQLDVDKVKAYLASALDSLKSIGSLFDAKKRPKFKRTLIEGCTAGETLVEVVKGMHKILSEIDVSALNHAKIWMASSVQEHCNNVKEFFDFIEQPPRTTLTGILSQSAFRLRVAAGGGSYATEALKYVKFLNHDIKALTLVSLERQYSAGTLRGNVFENKFKSFGRGEFAVDIVLKLQLHVEWMCEKLRGGLLTKLARDEGLGKRFMSDEDAYQLLTETLDRCLELESPDDPNGDIRRDYAKLTAAFPPDSKEYDLAKESAQKALAAAKAAKADVTPEEILLLARYERCSKFLGDLLYRLRRMDTGLLIESFKGAKEKVEEIRGKNLLLLLGSTGSGKSTTIWFLMNKTMKKSSDNISIVPAVEDPKMAAFKIGTGGNGSVTSVINAVASDLDQNFVLVDTPGFRDTRSTVIDIVNSFSISSAVQIAGSIRILALFSKENKGNNWEGLLTCLAEPLSDMMINAHDQMGSIAIKLTKFDRSDPILCRTLPMTLRGIRLDPIQYSREVKDTHDAVVEKICNTICALEIGAKPVSNIVLSPLPGGDVAKDVLDEIMQMEPISNPTHVFRKSFVNGDSVTTVNEQMSFDSHSIKHSSTQLLNVSLTDSAGVLKAKVGSDFFYHMQNVDFRLRQLRDLSANLSSVSSITGTFKKSSEGVLVVIGKLKEEVEEFVNRCLSMIDMDDVANEIVGGCKSAQKLIFYDIFMHSDKTHCSYLTPLHAPDEHRLVTYCINCARKLTAALKKRINLDFIEETCALADLTREQLKAFESYMENEAGISLQKFSLLCSIFSHVYKAVAFGMLEMLHAPKGEYVLIAASNAFSGLLIDAARSRELKTIFLKRNGDQALGADHTIPYEHEDVNVVGQVSEIIAREKAGGRAGGGAGGAAGGAAGGRAGGGAGGAAGGGSAVAVAGATQGNLAYGACVAAGGDSMEQHMKASVRRDGSVVSYEQKWLPSDIFTVAFGEGQSDDVQDAVLPRIFATFRRVCAAFDEFIPTATDTSFIPLCLPKLELLRVFDEMITKFLPNIIPGAPTASSYDPTPGSNVVSGGGGGFGGGGGISDAYLTRKEKLIARIQVLVEEGVKAVSGDVVRMMGNLINSIERGDLPLQERLDEVERFAGDSKAPDDAALPIPPSGLGASAAPSDEFFAETLAALALMDQLQALQQKCIDVETIQILYGTILDPVERFLDKTLWFICKLFTCPGAFCVIIKYLVVVDTFAANSTLSRYCSKLSDALSQIAAYVVLSHTDVTAQVVKLGVENADLGVMKKSLSFLKEVSGALQNAPANFKSAAKIYAAQFEKVMSTIGSFLKSEWDRLQAVKQTIRHKDPGLLRAYLQKFDNLNKLLALGVSCLDDAVTTKLTEMIEELVKTFKAALEDAKSFAQEYFNIDAETRLFRIERASLRELRCVLISLPLFQQWSEKLKPLTKDIQEAFDSLVAQTTHFFVKVTSGFLANLNSLAPTTVMAAFCALQSDADFKAIVVKISEGAKSIISFIEIMRRLHSLHTVIEGSGGEVSSPLADDFFDSKPRLLANQFGFELLENEASMKIDHSSPPALLSYDAELAKVAKGGGTPPEVNGAWCLAASLAKCELYLPEAYRGFSKSAQELKDKFNDLTTNKKEKIESNIIHDNYSEVFNDLPNLKQPRPLQSYDRELLLWSKKLLATSLQAKLELKLTEVDTLKLDLQSSHKAFFDGVTLIASAMTIFTDLFKDGLDLDKPDPPVVLNFDALITKLHAKVADHEEHIKSLMEKWDLIEAEKSLGGLQRFKNASFGVSKLVVKGKDETRIMFIKPLQLFTKDCVGLVDSIKLMGKESQEVPEGSPKSGGGKSAPTPPPVAPGPEGQPGIDAEVDFEKFDHVLGTKAFLKKTMNKFLEACDIGLDSLAAAKSPYKEMSEAIRLSISTKVLAMLAIIDKAPTDYDYCDGLLTRCKTLVAAVPASYNLLANNLKETQRIVDEQKQKASAKIEDESRNANFTVLYLACKKAFLLKNIYNQHQPNHFEVHNRMDAIGKIFKDQFTNYGQSVDKEEMSVVFTAFGSEPLDNLIEYAKFIGEIRKHIAAAKAEHASWSSWSRAYFYPHCFYSSKKKLEIAQQWEKTFGDFSNFRAHVLKKADAIAARMFIHVDIKSIADAFAKLFGLRAFLDRLVQVDVPATLNGVDAIPVIPFDEVAAFAKTRDALIKTADTLNNIYLKTCNALNVLLSSLTQEDPGLVVAKKALDDILLGLKELKVASDVQLFAKVKEYVRIDLDPASEIKAINNFDIDLFVDAQTAFISVIIEWTKKLDEDIVYNDLLIGAQADSANRDRFYSDMSKKYELVKLCVAELMQSNMLGKMDAINALDRNFKAFIENMTEKLVKCRKKVVENIGYLPSAETVDAPLNMIDAISRYSRSRDNLRACSERFEDKTVKAAARDNLQIADLSFTSYLEGVATAGEAMAGDNVRQFMSNIEPLIDCLINLHFLSIYALSWKKTINDRIDKVLMLSSDPQNIQEKLSSLNQSMLSRNHSQNRGSDGSLLAILHGHGAFLGVSIYLRNRRTNRSLESVLDHMRKLPKPKSISSDLHDFLLIEGRTFEEEYWEIVEKGLGSPTGACARILASVGPFKMDAIQGSIDRGEFPALIRNLMAKIFAWWTLNKMSTYVIHRASDEDQKAAGEGEAGQSPSWRKSVMHPLPSQIVAVMLFFHDAKVSAIDGVLELSRQFLQIPTGEGKSVLLGVSSTILALLGFNVDCACYSAYLSSRDYKSFRSMFEAFKVLPFVTYGTFEKLCEDLINAPLKAKNADGIRGEVNAFISYGDGQDEGAAARAAPTDLHGRQGRPDAVIIDEVDMFFSEAFYGASYRPLLHLRDPTITALAEYLWRHPETSPSAALASEEFKRVLGRFPTWHDFMKNKLKEMISDLRGMKDYKRDEAYVVDMGKMGEAARIGKILANHDGVLFNVVDGFCTMWAHFKEHQSQIIDERGLYEAISIPIFCGAFSFAEIPTKYRNMVGVTGTLETMGDAQKRIFEVDYGIKTWNYLPTMYGDAAGNFTTKRLFAGNNGKDCKIVGKGRYFEEITEEIRTRLKAVVTTPDGNTVSVEGRAVLVFFENISQLRAYRVEGEKAGLAFNVMTEETTEDEKESKIVNAVGKKQVTLLTKIFGRGTDFVCLDSNVLDLGGVHVIQTFLSEDVSEEIQIQGRCARMGENGSYSLIILDESLEKLYGEGDNTSRAIAEMVAADTTYTSISQKRREYFEMQLPMKTVNKVQTLRASHEASTQFVLALLEPGMGTRETKIRDFLSGANTWVGSIKSAAARTVVLMDATGSMGEVIDGCKNTIERMITRACGIISKVRGTDDDAPSFQVQFVAYRNYNAPAPGDDTDSQYPILEVSKWDSRHEVLARFLGPIKAAYGMGNEAVELAFQHVNKELAKEAADLALGLDPPRIKQVILVGDVPPNTPQEVEENRKHERREAYWHKHLGAATDSEKELAKMIIPGPDGDQLPVPVHCFYVKNEYSKDRLEDVKKSFKQIAASTGGSTGELDIKSPQGEEVLCGIVTTRILAVMEQGEAMVEAYNAQFGRQLPGYA